MSYVYGTKEWQDSFTMLMVDMFDVETEPFIMGTPSWIIAYERLIQNDETYRKLAAGWEGTVVIHVLANSDVGLDEDMYLMMDLWHGDCRSVRLVPTDVGEAGDFLLTASYERWKQVMSGEVDVVKALMQGKIKLRGDLPTIVRYSKAATRLVELVTQVPTIFLDDMTTEEIEAFKPWVEFFRDEYSL
jgi:putative sterol carrier protein